MSNPARVAHPAAGTGDPGIYGPDPIGGSVREKPNSGGYTIEATYTPFGKDDSWLAPWANVRFGLQYVAYTRFNGGTTSYDGFGRNAKDNDTLFAYVWLAF